MRSIAVFTTVLLSLLTATQFTSAAVLQKRDSADILTPAYGDSVTQNSNITVLVHRWGMSYILGANYTVVKTDTNVTVYGPVTLDYGYNYLNMTNIGLGSYNIELIQEQFLVSSQKSVMSTTVWPFTVVNQATWEANHPAVPTTTKDPTSPSTTVSSPVPSVTALGNDNSTIGVGNNTTGTSSGSIRVAQPSVVMLLPVLISVLMLL